MFIVVTGPESSGKTTMAEYLGRRLDLPVIAEYSRRFLTERQGAYTLQDIIEIGVRQEKAVVDATREGAGNVISDTYMLELKIWTEERYGREPDQIRRMRNALRPDLYILCKADLPWEPDPLRENPHDRDRLFELYLKAVQQSGVPYVLAEGKGELRMEAVTRTIRDMMKKHIS